MSSEREMVTRRWFLALGAGAGVGSIACANPLTEQVSGERGRLRARPGSMPLREPMTPGLHPLALDSPRDGLIYVPGDPTSNSAASNGASSTGASPTRGPSSDGPASSGAAKPGAATGGGVKPGAPLVVLLHGAGGAAKGVTARIEAFALAEEFKAVVLATDSRSATWDIVRGSFGPDVTFLDAALDLLFARVAIDATRLAIGGFSDGASYALSLGLINGDLFTHVMAFSPGFLVADRRQGRPAIFVSHGTQDQILPIDTTSRQLVPALKEAGYTVRYREFVGPHTVQQPIAHEAFEWLQGAAAAELDLRPKSLLDPTPA